MTDAVVTQTVTETVTTVTKAHDQRESVTFIAHYPEHIIRADDPFAAVFEAARHHAIAVLDTPCWRCGSKDHRELHHMLEWSLANGIDIDRFSADHPDWNITDEETFKSRLDAESNLLVLCENCHRGESAIHLLPYPLWLAGRWWKAAIPAAAEVVHGGAKAHLTAAPHP
jgi:5-methylcytosine-specific restriction endonuclease McrA